MKTITIFLVTLLTNATSLAQVNLSDPLKPPISDLPQADFATVNMSRDTITKLIDLINNTPPNDFRGMVVIKDGKLVVEEYFNTYWRETIHDIRSAGKSVTALLLGIAIDKGLVKSTEQSIYDFFPVSENRKPGQEDIRIKHLLAMASGLDADDNNPNSLGRTANWLTRDDWVDFALTLPMVCSPGKKYVYSDVCPMLVGAIIEKTSGEKLSDFAKENLFAPLDIREFYWYTGAGGRTGPMGNLYISGLDFAKIGLLLLNRGQWREKRIVRSGWIDEIHKTRSDISNEDPFANSYGSFWFGATKVVNGNTYDFLYASGNGGNLLFIVPNANLVVVLISSAYGRGYGTQRSHNIFEFVLKSLAEQ